MRNWIGFQGDMWSIGIAFYRESYVPTILLGPILINPPGPWENAMEEICIGKAFGRAWYFLLHPWMFACGVLIGSPGEYLIQMGPFGIIAYDLDRVTTKDAETALFPFKIHR